MARFRKQFAAVVLSVLAATVLSPTGSAVAGTTSKKTSSSSCWKVKTAERGFKTKINTVREAAGLGKLRLDPELSKVARSHTQAMAKKDVLYHTPTERLKWKVTNWTVLGENVGVGGDVNSLHRAFMDSPPHAANVKYDDFRHVGVGVINRGGRMWVTVIFEAQTNPGTRLKMPSC